MRGLGLNRVTSDLDVVTSIQEADAAATYQALVAFDHRIEQAFGPEVLTQRNKKVPIQSQYGVEVDVLTSVGDFDFWDLYSRRFVTAVDDVEVAFASAADQLAIKRTSAGAIDKDIASGKIPAEQLPQAQAALDKDRADIARLELHLRRC